MEWGNRSLVAAAIAIGLAFNAVNTAAAPSPLKTRAVAAMVAALKDVGIEPGTTKADEFDYESELSELTGKKGLAYAKTWLKSTNLYLRAAGAFLYGAASEREETTKKADGPIAKELARLLGNDTSKTVRLAAARALGRQGARHGAAWLRTQTAERALTTALEKNRENVEVRVAAAQALGGANTPRLLPIVRRLLRPNSDETLAEGLIWATAALDSTPAADYLMELAGRERNRFPAGLRGEMLAALSTMGDRVNRRDYLRLVRDEDDDEAAERVLYALMGDRENPGNLSAADGRVLAQAETTAIRLLGLKALRDAAEGDARKTADDRLWAAVRERSADEPHPVLSFLDAMANALPDTEESRADVHRIAEHALAIAAVAAPGEETGILHAFESIRASLPEALKTEFDSVLRERMRADALARYKKKDSCDAACDLAKNSKLWSRPEFVAPTDMNHVSSFSMAMRSLGAVFLAKAAPFCAPAKARWETLQKTWLKLPDCTAKSLNAVDQGLRLTRATNAKLGRPSYAQDVFAEQYWSLLLRESLRDTTLTKACRQALDARLKSAEESHARYLGAHKKSEDDVKSFDSLYTSYAVSSSVLSLKAPPAAVLDRMRKLVEKIGDPTLIPYYPRQESETSRGAAARAPVFLLALFLNATSAKERDERKAQLLKTLHNYADHVPSLTLHVGREDTHMGGDDLAPYYYYSTIPYAISATRLLLERSRDDAERKELADLLGELTGHLLGRIEGEGVVRPLGARDGEDYPVSPVYANPLSGLALLSVKACVPGATTQELGVLAPEITARLPAVRPRPRNETPHATN